jgi:hypothetical protein
MQIDFAALENPGYRKEPRPLKAPMRKQVKPNFGQRRASLDKGVKNKIFQYGTGKLAFGDDFEIPKIDESFDSIFSYKLE